MIKNCTSNIWFKGEEKKNVRSELGKKETKLTLHWL